MKPEVTGAVAAGSSVGGLSLIILTVVLVIRRRRSKNREDESGCQEKEAIRRRNQNTKPQGFSMDKMFGANESNLSDITSTSARGIFTAKMMDLQTSISLSASTDDLEGEFSTQSMDESLDSPKLDYLMMNDKNAKDNKPISNYYVVDEYEVPQ